MERVGSTVLRRWRRGTGDETRRGVGRKASVENGRGRERETVELALTMRRSGRGKTARSVLCCTPLS